MRNGDGACALKPTKQSNIARARSAGGNCSALNGGGARITARVRECSTGKWEGLTCIGHARFAGRSLLGIVDWRDVAVSYPNPASKRFNLQSFCHSFMPWFRHGESGSAQAALSETLGSSPWDYLALRALGSDATVQTIVNRSLSCLAFAAGRFSSPRRSRVAHAGVNLEVPIRNRGIQDSCAQCHHTTICI